MALTVNTSVPAMTAQRHLGNVVGNMRTSLHELSSGAKINSAKDDPAGLQISNRLNVQNRGFNIAVRNANDAKSVAQTIDGAMNESTEILMRIRDLSLQAANGSNTQDDRESIQSEIKDLNDELNRIAEATSFGGTKLLNGSVGQESYQIGADSGEVITLNLKNMRSDALLAGGTVNQLEDGEMKQNGFSLKELNENASLAADAAKRFTEIQENGLSTSQDSLESGSLLVDDMVNLFAKEEGKGWKLTQDSSMTVSFKHDTDSSKDEEYTIDLKAGSDAEQVATRINGQQDYIRASVDEDGNMQFYIANIDGLSAEITGTGDFVDQMGEFSVHQTTVNDIDVTTAGGAQMAVAIVDGALKYLDSHRAELGAFQNRLDHAMANLSTMDENVEASKSRIRDTDFAKATTSLTKSQILQQSTTAILAQAKQDPNSALNLLR